MSNVLTPRMKFSVNTHRYLSADTYAGNEEPGPAHFKTTSTVCGSSTLREHVDMLRAMSGFGRDLSYVNLSYGMYTILVLIRPLYWAVPLHK